MLAESGPYLLDLASKNGVDLRFEASVLGGIPIIRTLYESLAGNRITEANRYYEWVLQTLF